MMREPKCWPRACAHFIGIRNDCDETTERVCCEAYPDGIPNEIAYGNDQHLELRGDEVRDLVFVESDSAENE